MYVCMYVVDGHAAVDNLFNKSNQDDTNQCLLSPCATKNLQDLYSTGLVSKDHLQD